jgi:hypothetical protein
MTLRAKSVVLMLVCTAMLVIAAPALAASPATNAYGGTGADINSRTLSNSTTAQSTLPFTGLNAGLLVAIGVALAGGGVVIRRTVRTQ